MLSRVRQARRAVRPGGRWTSSAFCCELVEAEMWTATGRATEAADQGGTVCRWLKEPGDFPITLAIPTLNKKLGAGTGRGCEWMRGVENVLVPGHSGTGKTHIALALGLAACQRGLRVRFTTARRWSMS